MQLLPHNKPKLSNHGHDEPKRNRKLDQSNFCVKLHQPQSRGPAERLPRIEHAHGATTAKDLGLYFSAKGAVEGDDGLVFLGEHGSLHARETDVGGKDDKDGHEETGDSDEEVFPHDDGAGSIVHLAELRGVVVAVEAKGKVEHDGHVERDLLCDGVNGGWEDDVTAALDGGETTEPAFVRWSANNDVGPKHFETAESYNHKYCDDRLSVKRARSKVCEDAEGELLECVGDQGDMEATKACPRAGLFAEVADRCADSGSDGF